MTAIAEAQRRYQVALENHRTAQEALRLAHELALEAEDALQKAWTDLCEHFPVD